MIDATEQKHTIEKNIAGASLQYCFRVVTADDSEIQYSSYAVIDTTDTKNIGNTK